MPNHITEIVLQDHQSIIDTPSEAAATIMLKHDLGHSLADSAEIFSANGQHWIARAALQRDSAINNHSFITIAQAEAEQHELLNTPDPNDVLDKISQIRLTLEPVRLTDNHTPPELPPPPTIPPEFQEPYQPQLCWHWCQTKLQAVALSHAARRIQSIVNNNTLKIQRQLGQDMAAALGRAFDQFQQANQATNPTPKNIPHDQTSPAEQEIN